MPALENNTKPQNPILLNLEHKCRNQINTDIILLFLLTDIILTLDYLMLITMINCLKLHLGIRSNQLAYVFATALIRVLFIALVFIDRHDSSHSL